MCSFEAKLNLLFQLFPNFRFSFSTFVFQMSFIESMILEHVGVGRIKGLKFAVVLSKFCSHAFPNVCNNYKMLLDMTFCGIQFQVDLASD